MIQYVHGKMRIYYVVFHVFMSTSSHLNKQNNHTVVLKTRRVNAVQPLIIGSKQEHFTSVRGSPFVHNDINSTETTLPPPKVDNEKMSSVANDDFGSVNLLVRFGIDNMLGRVVARILVMLILFQPVYVAMGMEIDDTSEQPQVVQTDDQDNIQSSADNTEESTAQVGSEEEDVVNNASDNQDVNTEDDASTDSEQFSVQEENNAESQDEQSENSSDDVATDTSGVYAQNDDEGEAGDTNDSEDSLAETATSSDNAVDGEENITDDDSGSADVEGADSNETEDVASENGNENADEDSDDGSSDVSGDDSGTDSEIDNDENSEGASGGGGGGSDSNADDEGEENDAGLGDMASSTDDDISSATASTTTNSTATTTASTTTETINDTGTTTVDVANDVVDTGSTTDSVAIAQNDTNKYMFGEGDCTLVADGEFYCVSDEAKHLVTGDPRVYAEKDREGDREIFYFDGVEVKRITNNSYDDFAPVFDENTKRIVWQAMINDRLQIMMYEIKTNITRQITTTRQNSSNPDIEGGIVVWQEWVDTNWEIMMTNVNNHGAEFEIEQLTNNMVHDMFPQMHNRLVTWQREKGNSWEVVVHDLHTGEEYSLEKNEDTKYENPRFVLLFDSRHENGDVETIGYDIETGDMMELGTKAKKIPEKPVTPKDKTQDAINTESATSTQMKVSRDDSGGSD